MKKITSILPSLFNFELGREGIKSFNKSGLKLIKDDENLFHCTSLREKMKNKYIWLEIGKLMVNEKFTKTKNI